MRKLAAGILISIISILLLASIPAIAATSDTVTYGDRVTIFFDEREWSLGADNAKTNIFYEYVLRGQSVQNWQELITLQVYKGMQQQGTADAWGKRYINGLYQACGNKVSVSVIRNDPADFMFEFKVNGHPQIADQHEIQRIITGKESLVVLHYAIKTSALTQGDRAKWLDILDKATVK